MILDEGRVIEIGLKAGDKSDIFFTHAKLPVIFQICHESRNRALEKHDLLTIEHALVNSIGSPESWRARNKGPQRHEPLKLLINYEVDIIYPSMKTTRSSESRWSPETPWHQSFGLEHFIWHLLDKNWFDKKLHYLALNRDLGVGQSIQEKLVRFEKLKKMYMVFDEDRAQLLTRENDTIKIEARGITIDRLTIYEEIIAEFRRGVLAKYKNSFGGYRMPSDAQSPADAVKRWNASEIVPAYARRNPIESMR